MKYKIEYLKNKLPKGFIGMNKYAADLIGIPYKHKHPAHTISVYKGKSKKIRLHTIRHEEAEEYFIKNRHLNYKTAHRLALEYEKLNKPFKIKYLKLLAIR